MSDNNLPGDNVPPATRGHKKGWPTVSGQVKPETYAALTDIRRRQKTYLSDVVREACEQYVDREAA